MTANGIGRRTAIGLALSATAARGTARAQAPKRGGEFIAACYAGTNSLDPHFNASYPARTLLFGTFESLLTVDENGSAIPMLVERYSAAPDGLGYEFVLRKDVHFHNGKEMTSADAKASIERFARVSPEKILMDAVTAIETPDATTLRLKLRTPTPNFIDRFASPTSPCAIIPAEEAVKDINKTNPIGTGPFEIAEWIPNDHMLLKRFDGYSPNTAFPGPVGFGGRKTVNFDTVRVRIMLEPSARVAALESGQVHFMDDVPPAAAKRLREAGKLALADLKRFQIITILLNHAEGATRDLHVRRAIQAALDPADSVPAAADNGPYELEPGLLFPNNPLYTEAGKELYAIGAADRAKKELVAAGYKGDALSFDIANLPTYSRTGIVSAEQLKAAGFAVDNKVMDIPTVLSAMNEDRGWNMMVFGFASQPFLGAYSYERLLRGPFNVARAKSDPGMDALWTEFNAATDPAARKTAWAKIQARVYEQVYFVKLGDLGMTYAMAPNVKGFTPWPCSARFWDVSMA